MIGKRILAAILSVAMLTGFALAGSSFSDVKDETTAVNADILRLMGVVNGSGDNRFSPDDALTRAQFCAMAVRVLGRESEVRGYENRTIFTDVASRHWARGYVNLAANIMVGDGNTRLIAGVGDGKFLPDETITWAQAVTIVLRMLGYGDNKAGAVWPQGYLELAASLKLGTSLSVGAGDSITRGQAAQLFADLLVTSTAAGEKYYASLGSVRQNVILFSVDQTQGKLVTSEGEFAAVVKDALPAALVMRKGTLVLNEKNEVVVFLPDTAVTSKTVKLKSDATASSLYADDGVVYPVGQQVFAVIDGVKTVFAPEQFKTGTEAELILESGRLICVLWNRPEEKFVPGEAKIVSGPATYGDLAAITGGASDYRVERDGLEITLSDLQPYEAVTYDPVKKVLSVSSLRLSCVYEEASPDPKNPSTITVLGHKFPVLLGASETIRNYSVGDKVTLLLTKQGAVAGMAPAELGGTAIGLALGGEVILPLADGEHLRLAGTVDEKIQGSLVRVSAGKSGLMQLTTAYPISVDSAFDPDAMTLGSRKISPDVRVYEGYDGRITSEISGQLGDAAISAEKIIGCYVNSAGAVTMIVVEDFTGDSYTYGILKRTTVSGYSGGMGVVNSAVSVVNGNSETVLVHAKPVENGVFGGVVSGGRSVAGTPIAGNVVTLRAISGIGRKDFYVDKGAWFVRAGGEIFPVAENVWGYIETIQKWFSNDPEVIRAYSDDMTVYVDPIGGKVRIITV